MREHLEKVRKKVQAASQKNPITDKPRAPRVPANITTDALPDQYPTKVNTVANEEKEEGEESDESVVAN